MPASRRYILVSRHAATREWLADIGQRVDEAISHLETESIRRGDVVIGNLPLHIVAEVNRRGGSMLHLAIDLEPADRGRELTREDLHRLKPRLMPLKVLEDEAPPASRPPAAGRRTLVTLLGAPGSGDYRRCLYRSGEREHSGIWMPEALIDMRRNGPNPITRLLVIGTSGSGWDMLARVADLAGTALEMALFEAMSGDGANSQSVRALESPLQACLGIDEVELLVVPYATDADAGTALAALLGQHLKTGETVIFDATFGLRDVMMTTFTALLALQNLRDITIEEVVYAAITAQRPDHAEIRSMAAIPEILSWVRALAVLDATGSLDELGALFRGDKGFAALIDRQQQDERLLRPRQAAEKARQLLGLIGRSTSSMSSLFGNAIMARLGWAKNTRTLSAIQAALALQALQGNDALRATALAFEACVSRFGENAYGHDAAFLEDPYRRRALQAELNDAIHGGDDVLGPVGAHDYRALRDVRNAMLHTSEPHKPRIANLLRDSTTLEALVLKVASSLSSPAR